MTENFARDDLRPEYFGAVFESSLSACECPEQFAVVTAYNPHGRCIPVGENERRDRTLQQDLVNGGLVHWRVTGCSADDSHREPGYAIQTSLDAAISVGRDLAQQAVFWIDHDELSLVSCRTAERVSLGSWAARLRGHEPAVAQ